MANRIPSQSSDLKLIAATVIGALCVAKICERQTYRRISHCVEETPADGRVTIFPLIAGNIHKQLIQSHPLPCIIDAA